MLDVNKSIVSVIVATLGRTAELKRLLNSIVESSFKNIEVIIVDQNEVGYLDTTLEPFCSILVIKYIHSTITGVALNKNKGFLNSKGGIITFSDDDSYYDIDSIEKAVMLLGNFDAISGRPWCPIINSRSMIRTSNYELKINGFNYFNSTIEFAMFWKKSTLEKVGLWDELLGVGGRWGSEGGADLVIRTLKEGFKIHYFPELIIYHENQLNKNKDKVYSYSKGHGAFMAKGIFMEKNWRVIPYSFIIILASLVKIPFYYFINDTQKTTIYKNRIRGILKGFTEYYLAVIKN